MSEFWFKISAPPAPLGQLSYKEYIECMVLMGRLDGDGED